MRDVGMLGLTTVQVAEIDKENAERMYLLNRKDGPTPFYLDCPLDATEDVARGLREGAIHFLWGHHVIQLDGQEWRLDGDLELWRKAKDYAHELADSEMLIITPLQDGVAYVSRRQPAC